METQQLALAGEGLATSGVFFSVAGCELWLSLSPLSIREATEGIAGLSCLDAGYLRRSYQTCVCVCVCWMKKNLFLVIIFKILIQKYLHFEIKFCVWVCVCYVGKLKTTIFVFLFWIIFRSEFGAGRISWCSSAECHEERGARYGSNSPTTFERRYTYTPHQSYYYARLRIYLALILIAAAISLCVSCQVTSSRTQRRSICDSNLAFGKFLFISFDYFESICRTHTQQVCLVLTVCLAFDWLIVESRDNTVSSVSFHFVGLFVCLFSIWRRRLWGRRL